MTRKLEDFFVAGAARVDITPPPGTLINGDFFPRHATSFHDALFVKAVYMKHGSVRIVLIVVDTCVMSIDYTRNIRLQVETVTGIPFQHICISTTHTHSAGSVSEVHLCGPDPVYSELLPTKIIEVVQLAIDKSTKARIAFGSVSVPEHVLCRRYIMSNDYSFKNPVTGKADKIVTNPAGSEKSIQSSAAITDPELGYFAIQDLHGNWISIFANYSLHYAGDWQPGIISSDYFGEFEKQLRSMLDVTPDFIGIMSNGTSGDVNCRDFLHPHRYPVDPAEKTKLIAKDIAARVVESVSELSWEENPELSVQYEELQLRLRKPTPEEMESAKKIMDETDYTSLILNEDGLRRIYAREQVLLFRCSDEMLYPIQAFKIGQGMIGSISGEIFAETGLAIKHQTPTKKYFTISLANGNAGYIPPAHEIERGGYETWRCRYSCLQPEAESLLRHRLIGMLQALY